MANLSIAILGLNRVGASVGLALRRYMANGGSNTFEIVGFDLSRETAKKAKDLNAIDRSTSRLYEAVQGCDLVVMALPYEEVKAAYEAIGADLRDGAVILDASPLKRPSLQWADKFLEDEHHIIGITPILNPKYLYERDNRIEAAAEDLFDQSAIVLTPSVSAIKAAVDLAFNFAQILGSKPRFLDPIEHDALLAQTEGLPALLGMAYYYNLMHNDSWHDMRWFTNPAFGVLTQSLRDVHPDGLRDEWLSNSDVLVRSLDELIDTLKQLRVALADRDRRTIEAVTAEAAESYEQWLNSRHRADWDKDAKMPKVQSAGIVSSLFGSALGNRLTGKDKDDDD